MLISLIWSPDWRQLWRCHKWSRSQVNSLKLSAKVAACRMWFMPWPGWASKARKIGKSTSSIIANTKLLQEFSKQWLIPIKLYKIFAQLWRLGGCESQPKPVYKMGHCLAGITTSPGCLSGCGGLRLRQKLKIYYLHSNQRQLEGGLWCCLPPAPASPHSAPA